MKLLSQAVQSNPDWPNVKEKKVKDFLIYCGLLMKLFLLSWLLFPHYNHARYSPEQYNKIGLVFALPLIEKKCRLLPCRI